MAEQGKTGIRSTVVPSAAIPEGRPEGKIRTHGLSIPRRWTRPGIHPFDEIAWELRTAAITNEKGEVVFEQKDVEVPSFYSQLATNVVVSKYFRGALGTPQRERSVKQLIGRVANTITDWGMKDGYFATEQDADTFRAELTYLLVHQYAAFNSPVWFNVGIEPRPQCSACQPYHALINTVQGLMPIGEIVEKNLIGLPVYDGSGLTQVVAVKHNGRKPVYRVRLNDGFSVEATADHLVCAHEARRTHHLEWRRVDQLTLGMAMRVYAHASTTVTAPAEANAVAEAALAGWLQADGFVGQYTQGTNQSLTVEFMTVDEQEFDWVMAHVEQVFPGQHYHVSDVETQDQTLRCRRIRLYGETLRPFVERYGLLRRGQDLRVPEPLWIAPNDAAAAYVKSLFQSDGYAAVHVPSAHVAFAVTSKAWAEELQRLLTRFGIYARLRQKKERRPDRYDLWELDISIRSEREAFQRSIGFISERKNAKLRESLQVPGKQCPEVRFPTVVSIEPLGEMDVYDIQTVSGCYLTNSVLVHNCFILSVDDTMDSILEWYRNEGMIFKYGSGSGLNVSPIRSSQERLAGGGTASGPVSFMKAADASAGVIKSGGKCFKQGTLVATPEGWRPIESLQVGQLVLTHEGPRAVADFMPNGRKQCYRVRAREGYEVEVTTGHKFAYWNAGDGRFETRPIEQFLPGEALYLLLAPSDGGETISLTVPEANDPPQATTTVEMTFPTELTEELAYVVGLMYGDGELRTEYPYRVRVAFGKNQADQDAAARFRAYAQRVFGEAPILLGDETGHQQIGFTRKRLVEFLTANELAKGKAASLHFPQRVFRAYPEVRAAFIAGVMDADGTYQERGGWSISSIDRDFLVDLQRLLLSLGVPSKIKLSRNQRDAWQPLYKLSVVGHTFIERLVQAISPHSSKARFNYEAAAGADKGWGYRPSLYEPLVERVEQRGGYRIVERTVGINETTGYGALVKLATHPDVAVADYAQELSQCVQVTLESVEPTEVAETYDIEVADVHLLSANGFYASNTRRAAKMVVLNADHPDVKSFILCKWKEEEKAHKLIDIGYDASIDGEAYASIFFQNANNSVRATDEFMRRALNDEEWELRAVTTGEVMERLKARDLLRLIAEATWHCGDPGMQFDTTVNDWHTCPNTGRINASNPCFTGDALVYTEKGLIPFKELYERAQLGEPFRVFTHDLTHPDHPASTVSVTRPTQVMQTGINEVYQLRFSNGIEVKATTNHRFFTKHRGMVAAKDLQRTDEVMLLDQPVELLSSSLGIDLDSAAIFASGWGGRDTKDHQPVELPRVWTSRLADYVGYLVGDGSVVEASDADHRLSTASVVCGDETEANELIPHFEELFAEMGVTNTQTVRMSNGTIQFRVNRTPVVRFLKQLGVKECRAHEKRVPHTVLQTPTHVIAAFLRGLFTADGCVYDGNTTRYVGLGSTSKQLLMDVQRLLLVFGIPSHIYAISKPKYAFSYTRKDGSVRLYESKQTYDLRILGSAVTRFKEHIGFLTSKKQSKLELMIQEHRFYASKPIARLIEREVVGSEPTYNLTEPKNHSYIVNGCVVANCAEYMHLDNSACNLSSINLLKFLDDDGNFLVEPFKYAVHIMILAQDMLVDNSSYPTSKITQNARDYRELGLGYANLGALLMSLGLPYDSDAGRAWAGAITAILCGHAYEVSGRIAEQLGPYAGFEKNREPQIRVLRKHRAQVDKINTRLVPESLWQAAARTWDEAIRLGEQAGVRNSQVTVIAPTGCLVGGSLVATDQGLMRLSRLGNVNGAQWQDVSFRVLTDDGPRAATKFYVNGQAPTRRIRTEAGHDICGTPQHRVKVIDPITGQWVWRRLEDIAAGDVVPLGMNTLLGEPRSIALPPLGEPYWASNPDIDVPRTVTTELAELVGYFMGDGSLHSKGLRFCVTAADEDVVERLRGLGRTLFHAEAHVTSQEGYTEIAFHSVALVMWWEACGFAKRAPADVPNHSGKGYHPHIPDAILATNDAAVYHAFLRGLFEADGSVIFGVPSLTTAQREFAREVATLLLALGYPTSTKVDQSGWGAADVHVLRIRNRSYNEPFLREIGFLSRRKTQGLIIQQGPLSGKRDYVFLPDEVIEELVPAGHSHHEAVLMSVRRHGGIPRLRARQLYEETRDVRLAHALQFFYDRVVANEDGGVQSTYDLSVPENTRYLANGFVSHNTIAFLMDCDTTGIEPDIALIKYKRLVGGGMLKIVNQTVPKALRTLGYEKREVDAILKHLDEQETIEDAPGLKEEHLPVFDCAFKPKNGERFIQYMGHVRMMGAVQPFISGAISKCVTGDTLISTEKGFVPIAKFYNEEKPDSFKPLELDVVSIDGVRQTGQFYFGGLRDVIRVELRDGRRITGTPNHRLYVATQQGLEWKQLDQLVEGEYVAIKLGDQLWARTDADLTGFVPSAIYGSQKTVRVPARMTPDLAWLLGAYTAEGNIPASNWTVAIHNNCQAVQEKVQHVMGELFGLTVDVRHERTVVSCKIASKTLVEFLRFCGVGEGAEHKVIPWSVLESTEACVRAFVTGLYLDGYIPKNLSKVGFCVASQQLVDQLQVVFGNFGILSAQVRKRNHELQKDYMELNAFGRHAQQFVREFAFDEPEKQRRAQGLLERTFAQSWADVVPCFDSRMAFLNAPRPVKARYENQAYGNPNTLAWDTLKRLVDDPEVPTTDEMAVLIRNNIHFVPVRQVTPGCGELVYDFSVPDVHAFVGNGIINHNTVNLPQEAAVEEITQAYIEAWKLGLKAIAIYRDGSKRVQPLSTGKGAGQTTAKVPAGEPYRRRLSDERQAVIHKFSIGGHEGYLTVGMFEDGSPGEIFIVMSKEGSTLSGVMDSFATAVSLALQYGVPLKVLVDKFSHVRFEPSGVTNNPDIRFAKSVVDYIFRWMALRFLPTDAAKTFAVTETAKPATEAPSSAAAEANPLEQHEKHTFVAQADSPACSDCGSLMVRNGNCYKCLNCGSTSGCS